MYYWVVGGEGQTCKSLRMNDAGYSIGFPSYICAWSNTTRHNLFAKWSKLNTSDKNIILNKTKKQSTFFCDTADIYYIHVYWDILAVYRSYSNIQLDSLEKHNYSFTVLFDSLFCSIAFMYVHTIPIWWLDPNLIIIRFEAYWMWRWFDPLWGSIFWSVYDILPTQRCEEFNCYWF